MAIEQAVFCLLPYRQWFKERVEPFHTAPCLWIDFGMCLEMGATLTRKEGATIIHHQHHRQPRASGKSGKGKKSILGD